MEANDTKPNTTGLSRSKEAQSVLSAVAATQWARTEIEARNETRYRDPLRDVQLEAVFHSPRGETRAVWGFWDGGDLWRVRFMPDVPGRWTYELSFTDGSGSLSGGFDCAAAGPEDPPGPLGPDAANPLWFGFRSGRHILPRSLHVGDRFFAENWPAVERAAFLDWAEAAGYNMISVASFFVNRDSPGRGAGWRTPRLWPIDPAEYRKAEALLDDLEARRILVFPFAGLFGRAGYNPNEERDQLLYIRYALARFGSYWNLLLNVAGPEPLLGVNPFMPKAEVDRLGYLMARFNAHGLPLTVHNESDRNPFRYDGYLDYVTIQGPKTADRLRLFSGARGLANPGMPLFAQETLWPGNCYGHPGYELEDLRRNAIVLCLAAAAINFGDFAGDSSSGFSGTMEAKERIDARHAEIARVWDFFQSRPFYRMSPAPRLADSGICLAEAGARLIAYIEDGDGIALRPGAGEWELAWIDARSFRTLAEKRVRFGSEAARAEAPSPGEWLIEATRIGN